MNQFYALQHLPLADMVMISASAPMYTVFFARIFIKEPIVVADIVNIVFVFIGVFFIVKPPFVFGSSEIYSQDPQAIYAVIAVVLGAIFFQANCFVTSRMLKGKYFFIRIPKKFHSLRKIQNHINNKIRKKVYYFMVFQLEVVVFPSNF